ncbi:type 1 glutamine amidotransferase domain-containing protein [Exilibacterium tricleocarpae]|uniref:Type 1 glutamine amidotransferase domain-containing protein n=1 Tax=Exilibacterium tricleocarpae TaxID=2591008 RepID=A0A545TYY9_9GAMM|nr:DJ-1/PfpI family protein [Exilibacterium tricleocarpae]TQV82403.1 type 1 glutamine amidotransferase domain-containing protein [Exilibacterium tricleocarpae]
MQHFIIAVVLILIPVLPTFAAGAAENRLLMVVSSHGREQGQEQPGFEFEEFAQAYLIFKAHGLVVDVASPDGGKVEADKFDTTSALAQRVLNDAEAMAKLSATLSTDAIDPDKYKAIFIVGGKGAMFDLPGDTALQRAIAAIYENRGTVAAVCHGPAALTDVKLSDGTYLVAGKAVNGFTNTEEKLFGRKWIDDYDFLLEDRLKARGGLFEGTDMMLNHVARADRLITGQNPTSTAATAEALLISLGITPQPREASKQEQQFARIEQVLRGDRQTIEAIRANPAQQSSLMGMYGYYYLLAAESEQQVKQAILLMELVSTTIDNPQVDLQIAKGYQRLGQPDKARQQVSNLLQRHPDLGPAKSLLAELDE